MSYKNMFNVRQLHPETMFYNNRVPTRDNLCPSDLQLLIKTRKLHARFCIVQYTTVYDTLLAK